MMKRRVVIESPLKADSKEGYERNKRYARACMRDSLMRGEAPYASHLLFDQPGLLDDTVADERELAIQAGFAWGTEADVCAIYVDLGISDGMSRGRHRASMLRIPVYERTLPPGWEEDALRREGRYRAALRKPFLMVLVCAVLAAFASYSLVHGLHELLLTIIE